VLVAQQHPEQLRLAVPEADLAIGTPRGRNALAVVPALTAQVTDVQLAALKATNILLWTKEGEADQALQYVEYLANLFSNLYPRISFEVVNKNVEVLREDFQTASLAGTPPDLLWTVSDHAGPFTTAKLIQPVDALFPLATYVTSAVNAVKLGGKTWGVPISNGMGTSKMICST